MALEKLNDLDFPVKDGEFLPAYLRGVIIGDTFVSAGISFKINRHGYINTQKDVAKQFLYVDKKPWLDGWVDKEENGGN